MNEKKMNRICGTAILLAGMIAVPACASTLTSVEERHALVAEIQENNQRSNEASLWEMTLVYGSALTDFSTFVLSSDHTDQEKKDRFNWYLESAKRSISLQTQNRGKLFLDLKALQSQVSESVNQGNFKSAVVKVSTVFETLIQDLI